MEDYAKIVSFDEFDAIREREDLGTIVATSGGYDPIHPGHATCLIESKKHGDTLVAIVNGDWFLRTKKGKNFQDLETRCMIVSCIRNVDYVIPFEIENDTTVCEALRRVRNAFLARAEAEQHLRETVERARAKGHSWVSIGAMVGTSGEGARQRYRETVSC